MNKNTLNTRATEALHTLKTTLSEKSFWIMLFLGFSAGLPILLVFGTLSAWLNEAGVKKSAITFFSWAGLGYGFKFVWAPLIDQARLPFLTQWLGRRRAWLLLTQILLMLVLAGMAMTDPVGGGYGLTMMALLAVALGFASASQDIVIDAYRIEMTPPHLMAMSASTYTLGYRLAMIAASAMAFILAEKFGSTMGNYQYIAWQKTYLIMAALMLVGVVTTLVIAEPYKNKEALDKRGSQQLLVLFLIMLIPFIAIYWWWKPLLGSFMDLKSLSPLAGFLLVKVARFAVAALGCFIVAKLLIHKKLVSTDIANQSYWQPVQEFIQRYPVKLVILLMLLIGFYRISDMVLGVIANVFYQDIGFDKIQIAEVSKVFGLIMTILGGFVGGFLGIKFGVMRTLMLGAILSAATNLLFMVLAFTAQTTTTTLPMTVAETPVISAPADASFSIQVGYDSTDKTFTLYGKGEPKTRLTFALAGTDEIQRTIIAPDGEWSLTLKDPLPKGQQSLELEVVKPAGLLMKLLLYVVIMVDNLAAGIATVAFVSFLSCLSNIKFTAMQYAIFSSVMVLLPRFIGGYSGTMVKAYGYSEFFLLTTLMGVPVIILVWLVGKKLTFDEKTVSSAQETP